MHTMWKGAVSFGLVHVPVKMFAATEDKDIHMRLIHRQCSTPISYVRQCPTCNVDAAWDDIVKGYEYTKGHFVLFEKEELDQLSTDATRLIQIIDFVDIHEIDPIYYQKTYYLSPDQAGSNAYNLLMQAMQATGKIGVAKISIRSKSSLAAIRVIDGCLAMETIFYPDEIRPISQVPNLPEAVSANEKELSMAKLLIEQLSTPFEPQKYTDDYRNNLMELINKKISGEEYHVAPAAQKTNVVDLMAALQASLEAAKASPSDSGKAASKKAAGRTAGKGRSKDGKKETVS